MKSLRIGIAGLGTVGCGTFEIVTKDAALLSNRCGSAVEITAVSSRDKTRDRGIDLSGVTWHDDTLSLADDVNVDVVVELIGGHEGVAKELCERSLANGKHVVTANKALIAMHGAELAALAEKNGVALYFEAAVAGGIPIIKALREGLSANRFQRVSGIMNGTCNYILTAMEKDARDFDDVLAEAQELGYAETPPDLDVDGIDTAHKLTILASLAYGCLVDFEAVYSEGIREVSLTDINYARELGFAIRLLGITQQISENCIAQRVHPCLVPLESPFASITGPQNAVLVECNQVGPVLLTGAGAGAGATASAVVADIMDIANGHLAKPFTIAVDSLHRCKTEDISQHSGEYYIRVQVKDRPGVLAAITSILSEQEIGVESVLQRAQKDGTAQIAVTTHAVTEQAIMVALSSLKDSDYVVEPPHMIRIENF